MTIEQISEWFQLAAQAMFASVALGEWSFYECETGPSCAWPATLPEKMEHQWRYHVPVGGVH